MPCLFASFASAEDPGGKPAAVRGEVVLARSYHKWMSQQIEEPCILPNPKAPGRLILFYSAVPSPTGPCAPSARPGRKRPTPSAGSRTRPTRSSGRPDAVSIRLDCVLYVAEEDACYIYYSATSGRGAQDRIGLATCPAGDDGYSKVSGTHNVRQGAAPVLAPEPKAPFYEEMASRAAVLREWDAATKHWDWFMYYSYRGKDGLLPGVRLATPKDGNTWTR